jgi:hypothetical protein
MINGQKVSRLFVLMILWAASVILANVLPVVLIAEMALAFCFAATLHAILLRLFAWMYRTSARSLVARYVDDKRIYRLALACLGLWYLYGSARDGNSALRTIAIECAFLGGIWLATHVSDVKSQLLLQLRNRV